MSDPRFTIPESPEFMARAEAVARQRHQDLRNIEHHLAAWKSLGSWVRGPRVLAVLDELRDLARPASYDAAVRWLVELLGPHHEQDGWALRRTAGGWGLTRSAPTGTWHLALTVPATVTDPREALCLALTAALEARRA